MKIYFTQPELDLIRRSLNNQLALIEERNIPEVAVLLDILAPRPETSYRLNRAQPEEVEYQMELRLAFLLEVLERDEVSYRLVDKVGDNICLDNRLPDEITLFAEGRALASALSWLFNFEKLHAGRIPCGCNVDIVYSGRTRAMAKTWLRNELQQSGRL